MIFRVPSAPVFFTVLIGLLSAATSVLAGGRLTATGGVSEIEGAAGVPAAVLRRCKVLSHRENSRYK